MIGRIKGFFSFRKRSNEVESAEPHDVQNYTEHGASRRKNSTKGWEAFTGSFREDIERNVNILRKRSRDIYHGGGVGAGAIKGVVTSVIGSGLRPSLNIDYEFLGMTREEAKEWEAKTKREFALWAESANADAERVDNFYELQELAFLSHLMSGDVFALLPRKKRVNWPYQTCIKLIESDRCVTPYEKISFTEDKVINGVEVDKTGEVVAFYIANKFPTDGFVSEDDCVRVDKYGKKSGRQNALHIMVRERPEQRRGIPFLALILPGLKQLERYMDAELMGAVINAFYTVFITSDHEEIQKSDLSPLHYEGDDGGDDSDYDDENDPDVKLGSGAVQYLREGEKPVESKPGRPNAAFEGFVKAVCRQMGATLEIPYEVLLKHFTASYSASRAAQLEANKMYRKRRERFAADFCQPTYEEWLGEAVANGRIYAPGFLENPLIRKAYSKAEWHGPAHGQLDPLKEAKASILKMENGLSTGEKEAMELTGTEYSENHRTLVDEHNRRVEDGLIQSLVQAILNESDEEEGEDSED